jgi:hypothetical protein
MTLINGDDSRPTDLDVDATKLVTGTVVVYFDPSPAGPDSFRHAVATGPEIIDPRTGDWWAPVTLPDGRLDLLPSSLVVGIETRG